MKYERLKKRREFLKVAKKGEQVVTPYFILQRVQDEFILPELACIRVGVTASKKIGNAVERNRAKRRLRALAHLIDTKGSCDYVLIARKALLKGPYPSLVRELKLALRKINHLKSPNETLLN
jgi:ribonuclease P protein component